jgi:hypothetical protein
MTKGMLKSAIQKLTAPLRSLMSKEKPTYEKWFDRVFDKALKDCSYDQMCNILRTYIRTSQSVDKNDLMWLYRTDILAFPVLRYIIEKRDSGVAVTHVDFIECLHMDKIHEILQQEQLSDYCHASLEYYLRNIRYEHNEDGVPHVDNVQNFCMRGAIARLFE